MVLADELGTYVGLTVVLGLYFLPTIVAGARHVPNLGSIAVINVFLGWTVLGWVIALAMAARSVPSATATTGAPTQESVATQPAVRGCPNCKRPMRRDVGVCPSCGSESTAWTFHEGVWWIQGTSGEWQWFDEGANIWRWYKDGTPSSPTATDMTPSTEIDPALIKPPAASEPKLTSRIDEIERLTALHERGALTDEEFQAAKAQVLNS